MTQIPLEQLRAAADALFSHLEAKGIELVTISEDNYWDVPMAIRYDRYEEPSEDTIGQLSDDIAELNRMLAGSRPFAGYGLVWRAESLRRIGETAN